MNNNLLLDAFKRISELETLVELMRREIAEQTALKEEYKARLIKQETRK